jgi:hypothetical protein
LAEDVVVSVLAPRQVQIDWSSAAGNLPEKRTVAGYHVERAVVEVWSDDQLKRLKERTTPLSEPSVGAIRRIGEFQRLTERPITENSYLDQQIDLTKPLTVAGEPAFDNRLHEEHLDNSGRAYRRGVAAYRVRVVDSSGNVSGPSPAVLTIPSSPEQVFSRENGTTCELKWDANQEKGILGYRVYRMDGRYDNEPVSRLTAEPMSMTTFEDRAAGKSTRRYYIIAVDAIGQEGFPSAPVWFDREWRDFYRPFTGDWHQ